MKKRIMLVVVGVLSMTMANVAQAKPSYGSSCSSCHGAGQAGKMEVTGEDYLLDLGVQLNGKERGPLKTFEVIPGDIVTLSMTVLDGTEEYAVELKRLEKGGQLYSQSNFLAWTNENGAGNFWTQQGGGTPYFTKDGGNDHGIVWGGTAVTYTFDLGIDAGTPLDVYDLEFAVAGVVDEGPKWYGDEHFYVNVVPEPTTILLLGLGGILLRKRKQTV